MNKAKYETIINKCNDCPYKKVTARYSIDDHLDKNWDWESKEDWSCSIAKKTIKLAVEFDERNLVTIPDWCPIIRKPKQNNQDDGIW